MKSGVIDTNILLYAANQNCEEHLPALAFLPTARITPGQWFLTEGICYEFLRVATHHRVFSAPLKATQALGFLEAAVRGSAWVEALVEDRAARASWAVCSGAL